MSQELIENIVEIDNGKMFTTSLIVAQAFDKEHKNVLRDIESLECSPEFHQLNFEPMVYTAEIGSGARREFPAYRLTRDGFSFLAMGFTGKKAAAWKEKFLMAFNAMEEALTACGTLSSVRQPLSLKASIKNLKARPEASRAVKGLTTLWGQVEGLPEEELEQRMCAVHSLSRFEQMPAWDLSLIEWQILMLLFRASGHVTEEEATPEELHVLNGLLDYCEGWKELPREQVEEAVCKICYVNDLKHLDATGIRKAELAVWTFMNRFSRIPDFIGYPCAPKAQNTDMPEK